MVKILFGIFVVLHGLVHLLYFGQSARLFELRPGMTWPERSWAFFRLLGNNGVRKMASILLVMAAVAFAAGGVGLLARVPWGPPLTGWAACFSTVIYIILWDGALKKLDDQGAIGILINLAILAVVVI